MFAKEKYLARRQKLAEAVGSGLILLLGNEESPMNYADNTYHFRQDSSFLYFCGLKDAGLAVVIDPEENREILFGYDYTVDDVVWMGPQPSLAARAESVGIKEAVPTEKLAEVLQNAVAGGRKIHFLPQYRAENKIKLQTLLNIPAPEVNQNASETLIKAVVDMRNIKDEDEIREIEQAIAVSYEMHTTAMQMTRPGMVEREVAGLMEGIALQKGRGLSFPIIFSIHGETLHNHGHDNIMTDGRLVVHDSGVESLEHYASDITRTYPVNGKFTQKQKEIYEIVLKSQLAAIDAIKPGVFYRDVHLITARVIADGLKELGLMKGDMAEAVKAGAHALFFPHGLGHMMGLDVHDMENLGEKYVGYDETVERSTQFGLAYLRLARKLRPGYVLTVEPGIYFIPELIQQWKAAGKFTEFINYEKVETYLDFGGVRIEDDVLVTENGHRVLGKPIPKTVREIEEICNQ